MTVGTFANPYDFIRTQTIAACQCVISSLPDFLVMKVPDIFYTRLFHAQEMDDSNAYSVVYTCIHTYMHAQEAEIDQLLASVPPHLLDQKITNNTHLEDIARSLGNWRAAVVYLSLNEADAEEIEEENSRTDTQRLVLYAAISQIVCAYIHGFLKSRNLNL